MNTNTTSISKKVAAAKRSLTVWFSAAIPVVLATAEAVKENLPVMGEFLTGWNLVYLSVGVSALVAILRVRNEGK
jgi:hypothetical protein